MTKIAQVRNIGQKNRASASRVGPVTTGAGIGHGGVGAVRTILGYGDFGQTKTQEDGGYDEHRERDNQMSFHAQPYLSAVLTLTTGRHIS